MILTLETVSAGLHCSFKMSRHIEPLELMLGWYTFVWKFTCITKPSQLRSCAYSR